MQGIAFTIDKPVRNYMVLHGLLFCPHSQEPAE